jgi:ABC-type branched-subunit amino acid transport system substrate-binding protein
LSSVGVTHKCYPVCNPGFEPVNGDGELRRFVRECMPSGVCEDHNHVTCQKVVPADCPKSFRLPADVMCQSVTFAGGVSKPTTDAAAEHQLWAEGMQLYANWTNDRGGLRLGPSEVGFVNVSLDNPFGDENGRWVELYVGLLRDRDVHVLLAPIQTDKAVHVIRELQKKVIDDGLAPKPILVTSSVPAMFTAGYEYVWAVDGPRSRMEAARGIVSMLGEAKAETFTIVGESTPFGQNTADNMTDEVKQTCSTCAVKLKRMAEAKPGDPFAIHEVSEAFEEAQEEKPDAFVAIGGHTNGFTAALDSFQENRYVPSAAVYVGGLATTKPMREKQKQQKASCGGDSQKHCFVFDQWIGTVSWTADMENRGPDQWLRSVPDRYKNRHVIVDGQNRSRYIGSASDFKLTSASYLDGSEPTQYHASAAATLLMFQLAVELAGNGTGLTGLDLRNATALSAAVKALDAQSTFFGPIKLNDEGWNPMFTFGIGQFQGYENAPRLIGPAELKPKHSLVYPAEWPCDLLESSDHRRYVVRANGKRCEPWIHEYNRWEVWAGLAIGLPLLIALCGAGYCYKKGLCCRREEEKPLLQRRSFFEDSGKLPGVVLAERDVATRWTTAQMAADTPELRRSFSSSMSAVNRNTAPSVEAMAGRQLRRDVLSPNQGQVKVFFSDEHVRELKPEKSVGDRHGWKDPSRAIGRGAYGTVYKATWRGNDIAVKVLALPDVPRSVDQDAKTALQEKLAEIILDYTKEVREKRPTDCCNFPRTCP